MKAFAYTVVQNGVWFGHIEKNPQIFSADKPEFIQISFLQFLAFLSSFSRQLVISILIFFYPHGFFNRKTNKRYSVKILSVHIHSVNIIIKIALIDSPVGINTAEIGVFRFHGNTRTHNISYPFPVKLFAAILSGKDKI